MEAAFLNARVITLDRRHPRTEALLIESGRIAAIGTNREIIPTLRRGTPVWNLDGAVVLPGFVDCHTHLVGYGLELSDANLREAGSITQIQEILREHAQKVTRQGWVLGHGWDQERLKERRYPNRFDLDVAAPDRPVCITRVCGHICVVNSLALRLANIDAGTTPPRGGVIDRGDETGEPTGVLRENAMNLVFSVIPNRSDEEVRGALSLAMREAVAAGLTSIHCVVDDPQHVRVLHAMNQAGELMIRMYILVPNQWLSSAHEMGISSGFGDEMLRLQAVKIFTDGSLGARTAALDKPYSDAPDTSGVLIHPQDELNAMVESAARDGLQVAIHAIGDRAISMALTAIENANMTVPKSRRLRHRIEHVSVLNHELIERISHERPVVSVQPHFIVSDSWVPARVGQERARLVYPLKSLIQSGATVVGGSDCPVEPIDPLEGIYAAVLSTSRGYGQSVDPRTAVQMFTKNAAYATSEENVKGTIQKGKIADLVILDRDPMKVPSDEIPKIRVLATIVGGKIVHKSKDFLPKPISSGRDQRSRRHV